MKRSSHLILQGAALLCLCASSAFSQIRQIDPAKLPQTPAVQHAYADLLPIDQYARTYEAIWNFPVPKREVAARFLQALHTLQRAQQQDPENNELQLFTGLVAHLAYNLDIEEAYDPALELLQAQAKQDFRGAWFLGIHQCQAIDRVIGMQRLLQVEASTPSLPGAFWQDYATCATATSMPLHAIRAYDNAKKGGDIPPADDQLEQTARTKIKPGSTTITYPAKQVWYSEETAGGNRFISGVCGESFIIRKSFHPNLGDVGKGTCPVTIDTELYPSRYGPSSASLLLLTQAARPGESLEAFAQRMLDTFSQGTSKDPHTADKAPLTGIQCPVATCLSFEIITNKLYKNTGGAHLIAVFFQSDQPAYPGLRFETPQPQASASAFFKPEDTPQRFSGTLYTFVALDANQDIYPRARTDFDNLLKSIVVDTK